MSFKKTGQSRRDSHDCSKGKHNWPGLDLGFQAHLGRAPRTQAQNQLACGGSRGRCQKHFIPLTEPQSSQHKGLLPEACFVSLTFSERKSRFWPFGFPDMCELSSFGAGCHPLQVKFTTGWRPWHGSRACLRTESRLQAAVAEAKGWVGGWFGWLGM